MYGEIELEMAAREVMSRPAVKNGIEAMLSADENCQNCSKM